MFLLLKYTCHCNYQQHFSALFATDLKAEERSLSSQAAGLKRELQLDTKEIQSLMVDREKVKEGLEVKTRYVANKALQVDLFFELCSKLCDYLLIFQCP